MSVWSEHLLGMPGVSRIRGERPRCDGLRWKEIPLKALYQWGPRDNPQPPTGTEKYRCRNKARYRYKACKARGDWDWPAKDGNYCYHHLVNEITSHYADRMRLERYLDKHPLPEE